MTPLTADELRELLLVQSLIRRDQPIAPFPDRLLDLDLVWRDATGKVHMTVEGLRVAKAARADADLFTPQPSVAQSRGVLLRAHGNGAASEHTSAPSEQAVVTDPFACHVPAHCPDGDIADTSIEHWYFCGAGSAMRSG